MITANPGLVAEFEDLPAKRVEAWDSRGNPMVIGSQGFLIRADSVTGYLGIKGRRS